MSLFGRKKQKKNLISLKNYIQSDFDYVQTDFLPTVKMSTYLIGIFITDFQCKSDTANAGVNNSLTLKACARLTAYNRLDYPLKASVRCVEYLQRLIGIPYPLPKLGMFEK